MSAEAQWTTPPKLPERAKAELRGILNRHIAPEGIPLVIRMLEDAFINQQCADHSATQKDFQSQLKTMQTHLTRASSAIGEITPINKQLLDQSCWFANGRKKIFNSIWLTRLYGSVAQLLISWVLKGVEFHLENMSKPDKAQRTYTGSVALLADRFEELIPCREVSYQPTSVFSRLVEFWLRQYCNDHQTKARSYIQKAKELRKSRK